MKKKTEFNDLLIPILCVLCVAPFIIYLAEYSCGYAKYAWHSDQDTIVDLYSYYRCMFLQIVSVFALIILVFRMFLYKDRIKNSRIFIPAVVYSVMSLLSAIFSVNVSASFRGNYYQFQSIGVLVGYWLICFYAYQILEKEADFKVLWYGMCIMSVVLAVVGAFQAVEKDLLNFLPIQKMVMSEAHYAHYEGTMATVFNGNNVFLTLCNPNYAGVFLTMMTCVFGVMCYSETVRWKKILCGIATLLSAIFMWLTYSRSTLISIGIAVVVFLMLCVKKLRNLWKYGIPLAVGIVALLLFVDKMNDFKFLSRMIDTKRQTALEEIITTKDGVELTYAGDELVFCIKDGKPEVVQKSGVTVEQTWDGKELVLNYETPIRMFVGVLEETERLYVSLSERTFAFGVDEEGYYYQNITNKPDRMRPIEKIAAGGLEYLGSSRVYVWTRTLPMLKNYMILGSGADTFPEVFPQDDYVGKSVFIGTPVRVVEKPHNDYLLQWVQNGFVALAAMIVFYLWFLVRGIRFYKGRKLEDFSERLGFGCFLGCICYMVGSFFNDSTLYTTPTFWVFVGISLASMYKEGQSLTKKKRSIKMKQGRFHMGRQKS